MRWGLRILALTTVTIAVLFACIHVCLAGHFHISVLEGERSGTFRSGSISAMGYTSWII